MTDHRRTRLHRLLDRLFWLIWLGFPPFVWLAARQQLDLAETVGAMAPELRPRLDSLPQVARFSPAGQALFWSIFAVEFAVYALAPGLAHLVVRRCAADRALVSEMIGALRLIGIVIASWAVGSLAPAKLVLYPLARAGDVPGYAPDFALDLPVLGVGLPILTMAGAMAPAVALREDAELTV